MASPDAPRDIEIERHKKINKELVAQIAKDIAEIEKIQGQLNQSRNIIAKIAACNSQIGTALAIIIRTNDEFRRSLPPDWDGDPVSDACNRARRLAKEWLDS